MMGAYRKLLRETCRLARARRKERLDRKAETQSANEGWKLYQLEGVECGRLRAELAAEREKVAELKAKLEATPEAVKKLELAVLELSLTAVRLTTERDEARARLKKALGLLREVSDRDKQFWIIGEEAEDYRVRIRAFLAGWEHEEKEPAPQPAAAPLLVEFPPEPTHDGSGWAFGKFILSPDRRYTIVRYHDGYCANVLDGTWKHIGKYNTYTLAVAVCNEHARQKGAGA